MNTGAIIAPYAFKKYPHLRSLVEVIEDRGEYSIVKDLCGQYFEILESQFINKFSFDYVLEHPYEYDCDFKYVTGDLVDITKFVPDAPGKILGNVMYGYVNLLGKKIYAVVSSGRTYFLYENELPRKRKKSYSRLYDAR